MNKSQQPLSAGGGCRCRHRRWRRCRPQAQPLCFPRCVLRALTSSAGALNSQSSFRSPCERAESCRADWGVRGPGEACAAISATSLDTLQALAASLGPRQILRHSTAAAAGGSAASSSRSLSHPQFLLSRATPLMLLDMATSRDCWACMSCPILHDEHRGARGVGPARFPSIKSQFCINMHKMFSRWCPHAIVSACTRPLVASASAALSACARPASSRTTKRTPAASS